MLDWSYAGYMAGEMPIPKLPLVGSVKDFGAVGDGVADDTEVRPACTASMCNFAVLLRLSQSHQTLQCNSRKRRLP